MGALGQVSEQTYDLIPQGEHVFTLHDIEVTDGQWGESLKWVWLLSSPSSPGDYIVTVSGLEKTLWQFTKVDLTVGSRQWEWACALTGRQLAKGDKPPTDEEVLNKRMIAYLTHAAPRNDPQGQKKEKIVEGSAKPFRGPAATTNGRAARSEVGAAAPSTEIDAEINEMDAEALRHRWRELVDDAAGLRVEVPEIPKGATLREVKMLATQLQERVSLAAQGQKATGEDELPF